MTQSTKLFTTAEIRRAFVAFFVARGHTVVPSSPLVPEHDPTLLFTNSGMVQFKDVFLGRDERPYKRATSVQACLRAGGKHNDLENVGYTARHHTFFEMLGNWSFGEYFKRESLVWGWELLTEVFALPPEKLVATVYDQDDEAYDIWTKTIGLPRERVIRIGDNKGGKYASDNFWMMADTGPCGPSSEIFYDHGDAFSGGLPGSPEADGERFIEIWNHVFMQFDMGADGTLAPLPKPCVDTGMGLERMAAVLQGVHSNYATDLFTALIRAAARETGCTDLDTPSLRVIADHLRAAAFLIGDGVRPGNEGRPYVLRRIIRRAVRHGYTLGKKEPFLFELVADLVAAMGEAYPVLAARKAQIMAALRDEEARFYETLEHGMRMLDGALASGAETVSGALAFKLHDTYGFPLDLTCDVAREHGIAVDVAGFDAAMDKQKRRARAAGRFTLDKKPRYTGAETRFDGYERFDATATVLALFYDGKALDRLSAGQSGIVVLDRTPFYPESGGQVGDSGVLSGDGAVFAVADTRKIKARVFGHHGVVQSGELTLGAPVRAQVDGEKRRAIMRNHSVTHLLHKALREVLGAHVTQKGSLVSAERTRFDFSHDAPLTARAMTQVEEIVNREILANQPTRVRRMDLEAARAAGAMMLFGEKYGESVRVLDIGSSVELCGGTHVARTGDIGLFKLIGDSGVAAGVRRVEGVTGLNALHLIQRQDARLRAAAAQLKTEPAQLGERLEHLQRQVKTAERNVARLQRELAAGGSAGETPKRINGWKTLSVRRDGCDNATLRDGADRLRDKHQLDVVVIGSADDDTARLVVSVAKTAVGIEAGAVVRALATYIDGTGGGRADFAQAGGKNPAGLPRALRALEEVLPQKKG